MSELGLLPVLAAAVGTTARPQASDPGDVRMEADGFDALLKSERDTHPAGERPDAGATASARASNDADTDVVIDRVVESGSAQVAAPFVFALGIDANPRESAIVAAERIAAPAEQIAAGAADDPRAVTTAGSQTTLSMLPQAPEARTTPNTARRATPPTLPDTAVPARIKNSGVPAAEPAAPTQANQPRPADAEDRFRTGQERPVEPEQNGPAIPAQEHGAAVQAAWAYGSGAAPAKATDQWSASGRESPPAALAESRLPSHHVGPPPEFPPDPATGRRTANIQIRSAAVPNPRASSEDFAIASDGTGALIDAIAEPDSLRPDQPSTPAQGSETRPSLSTSVDQLNSGGGGRVDSSTRAESLRPPVGPGNADGTPVAPLDYRLGGPEWNHEFSSKVTVFVSRRESQAEIQINPPEMGPVDVRISLQGNEVAMAFSAHQPGTRAAIESALPQLRDMLAANGLALGNTSVGTGSADQRSPQPEPRPTRSQYVQATNVFADEFTPRRARLERLVDTYA